MCCLYASWTRTCLRPWAIPTWWLFPRQIKPDTLEFEGDPLWISTGVLRQLACSPLPCRSLQAIGRQDYPKIARYWKCSFLRQGAVAIPALMDSQAIHSCLLSILLALSGLLSWCVSFSLGVTHSSVGFSSTMCTVPKLDQISIETVASTCLAANCDIVRSACCVRWRRPAAVWFCHCMRCWCVRAGYHRSGVPMM